MRKYMTFYKDWYEAVKGLPSALKCEVLLAMLEYGFEGSVKSELSPTGNVFFNMVKGEIDTNNKRYQNGLKGGRPKNQNKTKTKPNGNQTETKPKPNHNQNETKTKPNENQNSIGHLEQENTVIENFGNENEIKTRENEQKSTENGNFGNGFGNFGNVEGNLDVVKENFPHTPIKENIIYSNQEKNNKKKPLSKDRVKEKEKEEKVPPAGGPKKDKPSLPTQSEKIDYNGVKEYFNFTFKDKLPQITVMTDGRKTAVKARIAEHGKEAIRTVFRNVLQSPWLLGSNDRNWRADFDWLFKASNFVKVLEGKYIGYGTTNNTKAEREKGVDELAELARRVLAGNKP